MSYIPRSSLANPETASAIPMQVKKKHTIRVFNVITGLLLLGSIVGTVGVFFYKDYVKGQLSSAREALAKVSSSDYSSKLSEVEKYDRKLTIAHTLLNNHLSPTALFEALEDATKHTVQFKTFEYTYDPGFEAMLTLGGNTEELTSIALQKMQLVRDGLFSVFVVSDITTVTDVKPEEEEENQDVTVSDTGVDFKITGIFKKDLLEYTGDSREESSGWLGAAAASYESASAPSGSTTATSSSETITNDTI